MKKEFYCAVDIGGTKILLFLIDNNGQVVFREKIATPKPEHPEIVVEKVVLLLKKALIALSLHETELTNGVGICIAGFVDHRCGVVHQSPNLHWHNPVPLRDLMTEALACPVLLENDANAAVLGEVYYGAAIGHRDVIYVTISTGIGGGLFLDGRLYRGSTGFAGEIGHIKPFGKDRTCQCGGCDCLETWTSGNAIARSAASLGEPGEINGQEITTSWVFEQARAGNVRAAAIIEHAIENTGKGLANLVTLLNPSCIVIGGGVVAGQSDYLKQIAEWIRIEAIRPSVEITPLKIVPAKLEPEAGIWGLYAIMTEQVVE